MTKYRLSWRGVLFSSEALLYADANTPRILIFLILLFLYLPKLLFSYLAVTHDGIHIHYWPNYHHKVTWDEIDRIGKVMLYKRIPSDALYLHSEHGESFGQEIDRYHGIREKRQGR